MLFIFILFFFSFWRLGKYRTRLHIVSLCITIIFWLDKLRFLVGVSISNSQKLIEWMYKKVEGYSRLEKHYEAIQHN